MFGLLIFAAIAFISPEISSPVSRIEFSRGGCQLQTCPVWTITINSDRTAIFIAIKNNRANGEFRASVSPKKYERLVHLVNALDTANITDYYRAPKSESIQFVLSITYKNNSNKQVITEGVTGPAELRKLIRALQSLHKKLDWK